MWTRRPGRKKKHYAHCAKEYPKPGEKLARAFHLPSKPETAAEFDESILVLSDSALIVGHQEQFSVMSFVYVVVSRTPFVAFTVEIKTHIVSLIACNWFQNREGIPAAYPRMQHYPKPPPLQNSASIPAPTAGNLNRLGQGGS